MTITFLDSSTLTRGDIDFSPLEALGDLTLYDTTSPGEIHDHCRDADVLITNKVILDADLIASLSTLKLVLVAATGVNVVDLDAARARQIPVCNVAGYSSAAVSQHVIALLLNLATNVHRYGVESPAWARSPIFTRLDYPVVELAGKTFGVVGLGEIGSATARIAQALGMHIQVREREGSRSGRQANFPRLPHAEFFATSDVVSLHCPLTEDNKHLINRDSLDLMKPTALLLNAARGPLVDEAALAEALREQRIAGAGLDVLSTEPPPADHPLLQHEALGKTLLITPHSAWTSLAARERLFAGVVDNLKSFLAGTPKNRVA